MPPVLKLATAAALASMAATPAFAHPKLVASTPAGKATVAPTARIALNFSEKLLAPASGATLTMTAMPGMPNHVMKIDGLKSAVAADGKTLVVTLARPLGTGSYRLDWHVVGADTHRIQGNLVFAVR